MIATQVDRPKHNSKDSFPKSLAASPWGFILISSCALIAALGVLVVPKSHKVVGPVQIPGTNAASLVRVVFASGRIEPVREVKISPEVCGEITELRVREGQHVAKGDLLLRVKPDYYTANRDQAEGNYKSALANIDIAKARLQEAEAELKRDKDLYSGKLISRATFETATAGYEIAKAQLSNAEGQLETARGQLARAQSDLDKTTILSPITGTVARLNSELGERVVGAATMAGTEVMTLADLDHMEARVEVGETDIRSIACGEKARLQLTAFPDQIFNGTVVEMATSCARFGPTTGSGSRDQARFTVRVRLIEAPELRPGMSVKAEIPISTAVPALAGRAASVKTSG